MTGGARPRKRSITIAGHRTSLSLEQAFWDMLAAFAREDGVSINRLLTEIDEARETNLSSAARVYVVERLRGGAGLGLTRSAGSSGPPGSG
ncbi:MAG: ribbon-helix-helix domain-containing protein [Kiloniellales bacterium]|nr:ribbon-helix-helix domain-containing protein [Kiloniellales bacterium]